MLILFDNNVPRQLRRSLPGHLVRTAEQMQWAERKNGDLLAAAERAMFDVFVTADQNLVYQQNLKGRRIALLVLGAGRWRLLMPYLERIIEAVDASTPGSYAFIDIPLPPKPRRPAS